MRLLSKSYSYLYTFPLGSVLVNVLPKESYVYVVTTLGLLSSIKLLFKSYL